MDPYILFSKNETEEITQLCNFDERAKERDLKDEKDKSVHRNMPRMPKQREF